MASTSFAQAVTSQPSPTDSQPAAPPVEPAGERKPLWRFDDLDFELGFEGQLDRRRSRFNTHQPLVQRYGQLNRARRFEETVGLAGSGAVAGDEVMQFDFLARWGLSQERYTETRPGPDLHTSPHGDLLEYDLSLSILPRGTLSAEVFASRLDSRLPRAFLPSLDRTLEKYGASVTFNSRSFPMRFTFEHVWDELASRTREPRDDEQRGDDTFRYEGTWQISPEHALRLEYEHDERSERYSGSTARFDTDRDYLVLNHTLRFGPDDRSALETLARYQDERGDLARDLAEFSSRLRLQHTDRFATRYGVQYLGETFHRWHTHTWRGEAGLTHELGETLTTSLDVYGLSQNADDRADFTEWGGLANVSLARDNAWGRLSANLSYQHTDTDTRHGGRRGVVIGESVTFRDPLPAYLLHDHIDTFSLLVTDSERARIFLPGRDFLVLRLGRYTALRRVPTGRIADGQTVYVSYSYRIFDDYDLRRDRIDFRVQQQFKFGLTPYYAASVQDEDLDDPRFLRFGARNVNRHRLGAVFRRPRWSVGLEYEYNDDTIDPFEAVHVNGDVVLWQGAGHELSADGTLSRYWFDGYDAWPARNTSLLDVGAACRFFLVGDCEAQAQARYRYEDDSLYGVTHGVDLSAAFEWRIGYFSLRLEAEYDRLSLPGSRDDGFAFWFKLKRVIPVLAKGS